MSAPRASLETVLAYHERTKHFPGRYARTLGYLDWATQPSPFRCFSGAPLLPLDLVPVGDEPPSTTMRRASTRSSCAPN